MHHEFGLLAYSGSTRRSKMRNQIIRLLKLAATGISLMVAGTASAEEYEVRLSAYVPIECELSFDQSFAVITNGLFRIGRVDQFCNTGYEMTMSHATLEGDALARFRGDQAIVGAGQTVLLPAGRPVNSAADLFLEAASQADAELFASSLVLSVTPTGL
jgi:hypothetical protein